MFLLWHVQIWATSARAKEPNTAELKAEQSLSGGCLVREWLQCAQVPRSRSTPVLPPSSLSPIHEYARLDRGVFVCARQLSFRICTSVCYRGDTGVIVAAIARLRLKPAQQVGRSSRVSAPPHPRHDAPLCSITT
jgi:hypothetical protein